MRGTAHPRVANARDTSPTVSHGSGVRIFATCGANSGEDSTTEVVGPSATTSPSAIITTRVATSATSSTSCVARSTVAPAARRPARNATRRRFAP